jgi:hypothetical protein
MNRVITYPGIEYVYLIQEGDNLPKAISITPRNEDYAPLVFLHIADDMCGPEDDGSNCPFLEGKPCYVRQLWEHDEVYQIIAAADPGDYLSVLKEYYK